MPQYPLWVKSGHFAAQSSCPLYPQKRTLGLSRAMSALCQKRTYLSAVIRWRIAMFTPCMGDIEYFCPSGAKGSAKGSVKCAAYHSRTIEGAHRNDDTDGGYGCQFRSREN